MFLIVLKKMIKNKWLTVCLLIGCVMAVCITSIVPVFTNGILERMLQKDLRAYQEQIGYYPGRIHVSIRHSTGSSSQEGAGAAIYSRYKWLDNYVKDTIIDGMGVEATARYFLSMTRQGSIYRLSEGEEVDMEDKSSVGAIVGLEEKAGVSEGRIYNAGLTEDGAVEVVMSQAAAKAHNWYVGETYEIRINKLSADTDVLCKVRLVGIITQEDPTDLFWFYIPDAWKNHMFMDHNTFMNEIVGKFPAAMSGNDWYIAFDYTKFTLDQIDRIYESLSSAAAAMPNSATLNVPMLSIMEEYLTRRQDLTLVITVLMAPLMIMIMYYIFMVSKLTIEYEKDEIAVLKSRGVSRGKILFSYFLQALTYSAVALVIGPLLALGICYLLGSTNGFLEFVSRTALPVRLSGQVMFYSLPACGLFMLTMLAPVFTASKATIVQLKTGKARRSKRSFWERYFLDIILIAVSVYGLYTYNTRESVMLITGVEQSDFPIDPIIFLMSALFIIGTGLFFIRIFPYIVKLVFKLFEKHWPATVYSTLLTVARSGSGNHFIMLFLVLTLAIGISNANSARTMNQNEEDKIMYSAGADVVMTQVWDRFYPDGTFFNESLFSEEEGASKREAMKSLIYIYEPSSEGYEDLAGVKSMCRVFRKEGVSALSGNTGSENAVIMGIDPYDFGNTAWFRNGLLPHHINEYLNLMTADPRAVYVSSSFRDKYNISEGDTMYIRWGEDDARMEVIIYGFIDYWPTYDPNAEVEGIGSSDFVVANLSHILNNMRLEPYDLWIKMEDGALVSDLYADISAKGLKITAISNTSEKVVAMKNDPMLQGLNGMMTLGFLITIMLCFVGFLIYWIFNIKKRTLQFGIIRSIGMSRRSVTFMLILEQVIVSVPSVLAGMAIGSVASWLYAPLLQIASKATSNVPPFKVYTIISDYLRVYAAAGVIILLGVAVLWYIINKININQALKLGED